MQNGDEEDILLLRIEALKSTSRVNIVNKAEDSVSEDTRTKQTVDADDACLRAAALGSCKRLSIAGNVKEQENKSNTSNDITEQSLTTESHELILRQQALKSLLKKRVVKTGELIKKNVEIVQQKVSLAPVTKSSRLQITNTDNIKTKSLVKNQANQINSLNTISQDSVDNKDTDDLSSTPHKFFQRVSIGDDEVSLCASDCDETEVSDISKITDTSDICEQNECKVDYSIRKRKDSNCDTYDSSNEIDISDKISSNTSGVNETQNTTTNTVTTSCITHSVYDVQCNVISCSQTDSNNDFICDNHLADQIVSTTSKRTVDRTAEMEQVSGGSILVNNENRFNDYPNLSVSTWIKPSLDQEPNNVENKIQSVEQQSKRFAKEQEEHNLNMIIPDGAQYVIECEPGPSGYKKNVDSDSDHSVTEIMPPTKPTLLIIELSDSDNGSSYLSKSYKGRGKKRNSKTRTLSDMLIEKVSMDGSRDDLKDLSCSICLCPFENRSFLDHCFHSFCYICIIQWSELSRLCPLCKTKYDALIHTVTKDLQYQQYVFPNDDTENNKTSQQNERREFNEIMADGRRYRSTLVDTETWAARRSDRERVERERMSNREQRKMSRRLKWSATKDRRKAAYGMNMILKEVKQRGKVKLRDISPKFFAENPAMKHRLVPWLLRDLNVLLGDDDDNIRFVMSLILNMISKTPMNGEEFNNQLKPFLFKQTNHFVTELVSFASSPYDMKGYDDNVVYDVPTRSNDDHKSIETVNVDESTTYDDPFREKLLHEVFIGTNDVGTQSDQIVTVDSPYHNTHQQENEEKEVSTDVETKIELNTRLSDDVETKIELNTSSSEQEQDMNDDHKENECTKRKTKKKKSTKKKKKKKHKHKRNKEEDELAGNTRNEEKVKYKLESKLKGKHKLKNSSTKQTTTRNNSESDASDLHDETQQQMDIDRNDKDRVDKKDRNDKYRVNEKDRNDEHRVDEKDRNDKHSVDEKDRNDKHRVDKKDRNDKHRVDKKDRNDKHRVDKKDHHDKHRVDKKDRHDKHSVDEKDRNDKHRVDEKDRNDKHLADEKDRNDKHHADKKDRYDKHSVDEKDRHDKHSVDEKDRNDKHSVDEKDRHDKHSVDEKYRNDKHSVDEKDRNDKHRVDEKDRNDKHRVDEKDCNDKHRADDKDDVEQKDKKAKKRKKKHKEHKHKKKRKTQPSTVRAISPTLCKSSEISLSRKKRRRDHSRDRSMSRERNRKKNSHRTSEKSCEQREHSRDRSMSRERSNSHKEHTDVHRNVKKRKAEPDTHTTESEIVKKIKTSEKYDSKNSKHKHKKKRKRKHGKRKKSKKASSSDSSDGDSDLFTRKAKSHESSTSLSQHKKSNSNDSNEFEEELNIERLQEYLKSFTQNQQLDLIKDGDSYKTRAEVIQELLIIEKTIKQRKVEKEKLKAIVQSKQLTQAAADSTVPNLEANVDDAVEIAMSALSKKEKEKVERVEREKSYLILIQELQQIEGRINTCRS